MGFSETSIIWRVAMFGQILGFAFMLACVASDHMNAAEIIPNLFQHLGFWDICDDTMTFGCEELVTYLNRINEDSGWVYASRTMIMSGLITQVLTFIVVVYMAYTASSFHFSGLVASIGCGISAVFSLIGGIVFVVRGNDLLETQLEMDADPAWSFYMLVISECLVVISLILHVMEAFRMD